MKICIVNPGRCGGTLMLCYLHSKLPGYDMRYEIIKDELPTEENIIFKYQYLYTHKPLHGADKYIVVDRKDKDAWMYSTYMSALHSHHHGKLPDKKYALNIIDWNHSKLGLSHVYDNIWIPERERLVAAGADMVWYEDMKIEEDVYFEDTKLEPVWSCNME
tara:strand:+ start:1703 stop:2185 length:483 start_codon:yes stop_codon:yes gene_type:complete